MESMQDWAVLALQVAAGVGLAASAGLRAFLPLLATGVAGRLGWITLSGPFDWLSSTPALVVFGVAVLTEFASDKIPFVDHFLDLLQGFVKPVAGTVLAASMFTHLTPLQATVLGILVGGSTAGAVHLIKAKLRLVSSLFTGGLANPLLSAVEDGLSLTGTALSLLVPVLMIVLVVTMLALLILVARRSAPGAAVRG